MDMRLIEERNFSGDILIINPDFFVRTAGGSRKEHTPEEFGIKNYLFTGSMFGQYEVFSGSIDDIGSPMDPARKLGEFGSNSYYVIVCLLDEVLKFNPSFDEHIKNPQNATVIHDFQGVVSMKSIDDDPLDHPIYIIGVGNKPFFTRWAAMSHFLSLNPDNDDDDDDVQP